MNTHTRLLSAPLLLVSGLMLGACSQMQVDGGSATSLALGDTARGELTSASPVNAKDGSRYQQFRVALEADDVVSFNLSGALQGVLSLHAPDGDFLASSTNPYSYGNENAGLSRRVTEKGNYVLAVSGADHQAFGPFRVEAKKVQARQGGAIAAGEEIFGWLDNANNRYTLTVEEQGLYQITQRSTEVDAYLKLSGNGVQAEDDDSAGGLDARISLILQPGSYTIEAGWTQAQGVGGYTLAVQQEPVPTDVALQQGGALVHGERINGYLAGSPLNYTLSLTELSSVVLDMKSSQIDSYLALTGAGLYLSDDDSGEGDNGLNARITGMLPPGDYDVQASEVSGQSGVFSLQATVTRVDMSQRLRGLTTLRDGARHEARLENGVRQEYRLVIGRAGQYQIDMRSDSVDSFLELYGTGVAATDDDGGGGVNARISQELAAGEYLLVARSYDNMSTGDFSLSIARQ